MRPLRLLLCALAVCGLSACSVSRIFSGGVGCNIRTYIDNGLQDYISTRYHSNQLVRMAILPFEVPETFAPAGNDSLNFGRDLARRTHGEMLRAKVVPIVELFNRDRWPGKRAEFFIDNGGAIDLARAAGYDLVMVGYMEEIKDDEKIVVYSKIIDTENRITIWDARTDIRSNKRRVNETLAKLRVENQRPEQFDFPRRAEEFATCTVDEIGKAY